MRSSTRSVSVRASCILSPCPERWRAAELQVDLVAVERERLDGDQRADRAVRGVRRTSARSPRWAGGAKVVMRAPGRVTSTSPERITRTTSPTSPSVRGGGAGRVASPLQVRRQPCAIARAEVREHRRRGERGVDARLGLASAAANDHRGHVVVRARRGRCVHEGIGGLLRIAIGSQPLGREDSPTPSLTSRRVSPAASSGEPISGSTGSISPRASARTPRSGLLAYSAPVMRPRRSGIAATGVSSVSCSARVPRIRQARVSPTWVTHAVWPAAAIAVNVAPIRVFWPRAASRTAVLAARATSARASEATSFVCVVARLASGAPAAARRGAASARVAIASRDA